MVEKALCCYIIVLGALPVQGCLGRGSRRKFTFDSAVRWGTMAPMTGSCLISIDPHWPFLHPLFEIGAFVIGFHLFRGGGKRLGWFRAIEEKTNKLDLSEAQQWWLTLGAVIGVVVGAKSIVWLNEPATFWPGVLHPWVWLSHGGISGKGVVGALAGGWLGIELAKWSTGVRQRTGDRLVWPLLIGMMVGRVGCLLSAMADKTYGIPTNMPWGVNFGDGLCRHPLPLYEFLFLGVWGLLLGQWQKFQPRSGSLFQALMLGYGLFRFGIDFFKPGTHGYWGLNANQVVSLLLVIASSAFWLWPWIINTFGSPQLPSDKETSVGLSPP